MCAVGQVMMGLMQIWPLLPTPLRHPLLSLPQGLTTSVEYLTPLSAVGRVVSGFPQIINGGRFFDKQGNRVQPGNGADAGFNSAGTRLLFDFPSDKY